MGAAVSCGGSTGAGHVQHGPVPGRFSQRPPLQPTTLKTLQGHPNSIQVQHHKVSGKKPRLNTIPRVSNLGQKLKIGASPTRNYRLEWGKRGNQPCCYDSNAELWGC